RRAEPHHPHAGQAGGRAGRDSRGAGRGPAGLRVKLAEQVEASRLEATRNLERKKRSALGQFLTPPSVASFMASLFEGFGREVRLLEDGAGGGSLLAAFVTEACSRPSPPRQIDAVAYEIDPALAAYLRKTSALCREESERAGAR